MNPIEFEGVNCIYGQSQEEYKPFPVRRIDGKGGELQSCWQLSWRERFKIFVTGKMWWTVWTFGSRLQPVKPSIDEPEPGAS